MSRVAIKAVQDPRTLNKILHVCPPTILCSLDQLVSLWEDKIGKPLLRHYVDEQELVKKVQGIYQSYKHIIIGASPRKKLYVLCSLYLCIFRENSPPTTLLSGVLK
jgi:hypothetical protein